MLGQITFTAVIYSLIAGAVPAFVWLVFWLREDAVHPEPRGLIAATFIGGVIAVVVAIFAENSIHDIVTDQMPRFISWLSNENLRYTLWAATEEIVKIVAVAIIALNSSYNDEPVDAMVYCITVALGFAAIENTMFILDPLSHGDMLLTIKTGGMRFIGATLVHTVCSALIGFSLGLCFYRRAISKVIAFVIAMIAAIFLHTIFNVSIVASSGSVNGALQIFVWIWSAVVIMIVLFEEIKAVKPKLKIGN